MCLPLLFSAGAIFSSSALAQNLKGDQIKSLFSGNTISGIYTSGRTFSEYHAPDGRALGDSGFGLNEDACWNTEGDSVCYHYGAYGKRRTYCFTVEKVGESLQLVVADTGRLNGVASVENGNPRNHDDGGKRWSCDDLLSRGPAPPGLFTARSRAARSSG
jgi:hypothetical protein